MWYDIMKWNGRVQWVNLESLLSVDAIPCYYDNTKKDSVDYKAIEREQRTLYLKYYNGIELKIHLVTEQHCDLVIKHIISILKDTNLKNIYKEDIDNYLNINVRKDK